MFMERQLPQYCPQQSKHIKINLYFWTCMASEKSRNYQIFDFQNGHVADVWRDMAFEKPQKFVFYSGCTQTGHWNLSENTTHINSLIVNGSTAGFTFVRFFNTFPIMTALWSEKTSYIVFKSVSFLLAVSSLCFSFCKPKHQKLEKTSVVRCVALWTRATSQLWTCVEVCTLYKQSTAKHFVWTRVVSQLWTCVTFGLHHSFGHAWSICTRSSPFRSTLNTGYITALDMCEVCSMYT